MKTKWIDETLPTWMIFGEYADGEHVDIADINRDLITHVKREEAIKVINLRNLYQKIISDLIGDDYSKLERMREIINGWNMLLEGK